MAQFVHSKRNDPTFEWFQFTQTPSSEIMTRVNCHLRMHTNEFSQLGYTINKFQCSLRKFWDIGVDKLMEEWEKELHLEGLYRDLLAITEPVPIPPAKIEKKGMHWPDCYKHRVIVFVLQERARAVLRGDPEPLLNTMWRNYFPHLRRPLFCVSYVGWFNARTINHVMRLGEGILPEDPTQVSRSRVVSNEEFEKTATRWKEDEHSYLKNKELYCWERKQRANWNLLYPKQQKFLLDLGFILDLDEWSEKQAIILREEHKDLDKWYMEWKMPFMPSPMDTMDLLSAEATICHASHVGPDELEKAKDGRKHLECRSNGALWGQIKGWKNNLEFMDGHHGTRCWKHSWHS